MINSDKKIKEKILKMLINDTRRSYIMQKFNLSTTIFYSLIKEFNEQGYNFKITQQKKNLGNANDFLEDSTVFKALNVKLTKEQNDFILENLNLSRKQLAKKLKISKLSLNLILDKGL